MPRLHSLLLASALLAAQDPPALQVPHAATPPPLAAAAMPAGVWSTAALVPALTQSINRDRVMEKILPATQVRLLWDASALYIRFDCADHDLYLPFAKHDADLYLGDVCEVFLDPAADARQWFEVQVAANNATLDLNTVLTADPRSDADGKLLGAVLDHDWWLSRDYEMAGLQTAASRRADGWTVEVAIPAKAAARRLGTSSWTAGMKLHANLMRYDWSPPGADGKRTLLPMNWAPVIDGCPHISPQAMGVLELAP